MLIHIVSQTDTLAELSKRYCLPGCMILRANLHIAGNLFIPGLRLQIPETDFCAKLARHSAQLKTILEEPEGATVPAMASQSHSAIYKHIQYKLTEGDNIYRLAQKYKTSMSQILRVNEACLPEDLLVGQTITIPIPAAGYQVYTVKPLDSLDSICAAFSMTPTQLRALNDLSIGMYPGMQLVVKQ